MKGSSGSRHSRQSDKYHNVLKERSLKDASERKKRKEESYEELSRKKRKIESELQALDLEEAAERRREERRKASARSEKKAEPVQVKEEPPSDDDGSKKHRGKSHQSRNQETNIRNERDKRSRFDPPSRTKRRRDQPSKSSSDENPDANQQWGNRKIKMEKQETTSNQDEPSHGTGKTEKEKPDFSVSGKLAEDTNTYNGVVIKYNEPSEARKPKRRWRLYPFKGDTELPFLPIHRQSAYLFGRTRSIADIPIDHPSCSKQHAVLQFRLVPFQRQDGTKGRRVRPYIIDLGSSNGTFVNNKKIDPRCYVELLEKDVVKFGFSTREYVILHEESRTEEEDDDVLDSN